MQVFAPTQTRVGFGLGLAVLIALIAVTLTANPASAQDESPAAQDEATTETESETESGTTGDDVFVVTRDRNFVTNTGFVPYSPGGPVYACYFANASNPGAFDASGATRFGDDFVPDTPGGSLEVGSYYVRQCLADDGTVADFGIVQYQEGGIVSVGEFQRVAEQVLNLDTMPSTPALSPQGTQVTGVETWFNPPVDTVMVDQLEHGPVMVGLRARLVEVYVNPGDGSGQFFCDPQGFADWTNGAFDTGCSHTYTEEPESGTYDATIYFAWEFDWHPHLPIGQAPTEDDWILNFDSTTSPSTFEVTVDDLEAVITK